MNREVILALAGATLLSTGIVAAITLTTERADAASLDANALDLTTLVGPALEGDVALGATAEEIVTLDQPGLVNATFTLRWTATNGADTLRLTIAPSNATGMTEGAASEAENDGEIVLVVPIGNSAADGALGVGEWKIGVEFVSADSGLPAPIPGSTDESVAWAIETSLQAHA